MPGFTVIEQAINRMLADPTTTDAKRGHLERILEEIEAARREEREAAAKKK